MATSISGKVIDRVIAAGVAIWFRERQFTRRGRSFFQRHGELFFTANVQASKVNMPDAAAFAVNLGVEWSGWHHVWTGAEPGNPALAPTFIQARLHPTETPGRDHWWPANSNTEPGIVASEIVGALETHAGAFWSRYGDLDAVLSLLDAGVPVPTGTPRRLVHAALLRRAGRTSEARAAFAEAALRWPGSAAIKHVGDRLGLGDEANSRL